MSRRIEACSAIFSEEEASSSEDAAFDSVIDVFFSMDATWSFVAAVILGGRYFYETWLTSISLQFRSQRSRSTEVPFFHFERESRLPPHVEAILKKIAGKAQREIQGHQPFEQGQKAAVQLEPQTF